jgi:predicted HicB family RNase H-like nuclease
VANSDTWTVFLLDPEDEDFYEEFFGTREACAEYMAGLNELAKETAYAVDKEDNYFTVV